MRKRSANLLAWGVIVLNPVVACLVGSACAQAPCSQAQADHDQIRVVRYGRPVGEISHKEPSTTSCAVFENASVWHIHQLDLEATVTAGMTALYDTVAATLLHDEEDPAKARHQAETFP